MRRTRLIIPAMAAALLGAAAWWLSRPVPVAVAVHEVGRGTVESSISRDGGIEHLEHARRRGGSVPAHAPVHDRRRPDRQPSGQGRRPGKS